MKTIRPKAVRGRRRVPPLSSELGARRTGRRALSRRPALPDQGATAPAGLCATCVLAPTCALRHRAEGPVHYCEEFDDGGPAGQAVSAGLLPRISLTVRRGERQVLLGLCVNCLHRDTCTLPRSESGVWHCEEYA